MPKIRKKSPIHENADANITCDFGDGDISRSRSFLSNTYRREQKRDRRRTAEEGQKTDSHVDFLNLIVDVCLVCSETTSSIRSDVYRLVKDMKCQTSH